jgi:phage shock protein PspC (stress-responsive transcriptional regulator)
MNKVITINLNGKAYQLEEAGYELLHSYLKEVRGNLNDNPDQEEIIKDFEQAIAEKCDKYLSAHKNVVSTTDVQKIIADMGPIEKDESTSHEKAHEEQTVPKRLYRIREGAFIAGVCNGIAMYFGIDVWIVRALFIIFSLFTRGGGIGLYILMAFFVPAADTTEERAFARGKQFNAQEFIEEMKTKYGKYAEKYTDDAYWKKYAGKQETYWKNFGNGWTGISRVGTGIFTFVGKIVLACISIAYCIMLWTIFAEPGRLSNRFLIGPSHILFALFITACAYVISWPIRMMVREAYRHSRNITDPKKPWKQAVRLILWFIAIGFVVTIAIQSAPQQDKAYVPYGRTFWIDHHEFCIGGNYYCDPAAATDSQNQADAENTVKNFGEVLRDVSVLAPKEMLKPLLEKTYGPYITPELLAAWQNDPGLALGKETSSPYPDHINIDSNTKNADGTYSIAGDIIMMTSNPQDGYSDIEPVTFTLVQLNNEWRISAVETGKH